MIRLALPTGDLRTPVATLLSEAGLASEEYGAGSRALRLALPGREDVLMRVFREKDLPVQVALGNYDLGICSAVWVEELQSRYPYEDVTVLRPLPLGHGRLVAAVHPDTRARIGPLSDWSSVPGLRIVSEFPAIAERFARRLRLPRATVHGLWGGAEAYPPEDADIAILPARGDTSPQGLHTVATLMEMPALLIGNRRALAGHDLSALLGPLLTAGGEVAGTALRLPRAGSVAARPAPSREPVAERETVRLAIPDGHAQRHTWAALQQAGIVFDGYEEKRSDRRPATTIPGLEVKVIRPQDMPAQVALGAFDLAITGRDWLMDHLWAFPGSPVAEAVDLGRSRYGIVAAVSEDVPADTLAEAVTYWRETGRQSIRVASEYPNVADHFARTHHLGRYQVIPVNGASEAFVPDDSEILIEGTETGSSFRANRLKGIARVFESTNCVIRSTRPVQGQRADLLERLLTRLHEGALQPAG